MVSSRHVVVIERVPEKIVLVLRSLDLQKNNFSLTPCYPLEIAINTDLSLDVVEQQLDHRLVNDGCPLVLLVLLFVFRDVKTPRRIFQNSDQ